MNIGHPFELAVWLSGTETPDVLLRFQRDISEAILRIEMDNDVTCGPIRYTEKKPGEARVPQVPKHISGPDVRLLVAETEVVAVKNLPLVTTRRFIDDLDVSDLARLRTITRQAAMKAGRGMLTDEQCDAIIEHIGPESAGKAVMHAVNAGLVH